ncbi:MAG: hypothetical protein RMJ43_16375 [Chloroherpetonaceae bacterium]|nr:hypothetical protein [Chthonomonadaceae bacterium]MDW8209408.1 hypothetical protein [Chloroherpetonaceae bacterium]
MLRLHPDGTIICGKVLSSPSGARRAVSEAIRVMDASLWQRLQEYADADGAIHAELVLEYETFWGIPGIPVVLKDFRKVS